MSPKYAVKLTVMWNGDLEVLRRELRLRVPYCEVKRITKMELPRKDSTSNPDLPTVSEENNDRT